MAEQPNLEAVQAKIARGEALDEPEQRLAEAAAIYVHEPSPAGHPSAAVPPQTHPTNAGQGYGEPQGPAPENDRDRARPASPEVALGHHSFVEWVTTELSPRMQSLDERMKLVEDFCRALSSGDIAGRLAALEARPSVAPETIIDLQERLAALDGGSLVSEQSTTPEDGE